MIFLTIAAFLWGWSWRREAKDVMKRLDAECYKHERACALLRRAWRME